MYTAINYYFLKGGERTFFKKSVIKAIQDILYTTFAVIIRHGCKHHTNRKILRPFQGIIRVSSSVVNVADYLVSQMLRAKNTCFHCKKDNERAEIIMHHVVDTMESFWICQWDNKC